MKPDVLGIFAIALVEELISSSVHLVAYHDELV